MPTYYVALNIGGAFPPSATTRRINNFRRVFAEHFSLVCDDNQNRWSVTYLSMKRDIILAFSSNKADNAFA